MKTHVLPSFTGKWRVVIWPEWLVKLYIGLYMAWYTIAKHFAPEDWWQ